MIEDSIAGVAAFALGLAVLLWLPAPAESVARLRRRVAGRWLPLWAGAGMLLALLIAALLGAGRGTSNFLVLVVVLALLLAILATVAVVIHPEARR